MDDPLQRLNAPLPYAELRRRWSAVRESMAAAGLDALLVRATNDYLGGYVRWFTDLPTTTGYPMTIVFPAEGGMTVVSQGQLGLDRRIDPEGEGPWRGVSRLLGAPGYASVAYSAVLEHAAVALALEPHADAAIGVLGAASIPYGLMDHLRDGVLRRARLSDASDLVDSLKARKSEEEQRLIRATARMQDACMQAVFESVRPGMRDIEAGAIAQRAGHALGSEQGVFLATSAPVGTAVPYGPRHYQNRVIERGDYLNVLIENNGPGGFYTELGRMCVFGRADGEVREQLAFASEAQRFVVARLQPGAVCGEIWAAYNDFMVANGRPREQRLFSHGQGYDLVERPLIRHDETQRLEAGTNVSCHPSFAAASGYYTLCDNFLVGENGVEPLHAYSQEIVEIT